MNTQMFWNRVQLCIKHKGVTQKGTAEACGLSFSTFCNWITINANPPLIYIHRISKYLGVNPEYLITGKCEVNKGLVKTPNFQ